MRFLKVSGIVLSLVFLILGATLFWVYTNVDGRLNALYYLPLSGISHQVEQGDLALGKRIVMVRNGCVECHGADMSGLVIEDSSAFGYVASANVTPFGIGNWSDEQVIRAIRNGIGRNGKTLILMPAHEYQLLSKGDVLSVVKYLRSLPAVDKDLGDIRLGPVITLLIAFGEAPTMLVAEVVDHDADFVIKPPENMTAEFGEYLVSTACTGCHRTDLTGGPIPGAPPDWIPAADISKSVMSQWTEADFNKALRQGINPEGDIIQPPMSISLTTQMTELEMGAIWAYIGGQ